MRTRLHPHPIPPPTQDPASPRYNVPAVAGQVADTVATRRDGRYLHPDHVLLVFGNDFAFQDAPVPFENMERVMRYVNARPDQFGFEVRYC